MTIRGWAVTKAGAPMEPLDREADPGSDEVVVKVAGCGICHTDLGFLYEGVPTRHPIPLILGHEISGAVVSAGRASGEWEGRRVIVPAVIPCGRCPACLDGRPSICARQIFPGNDVHGGFATHVVVPARGLCPIPDLSDREMNPGGLDLATLCVIADAVSTPFQAIRKSRLDAGDLAVFVGAGGVGGFGVQIAAALGAVVAAVDVDARRLEMMASHGADLTLNAGGMGFKELRAALRGFAEERQIPSWRQKIFETSGTAQGQATAFGLLGHGGYLGVVGYTPAKAEIRLSNLMALDATAQGNWGCAPDHYPAVLSLVLGGKVKLAPFVEKRPLATINESFEAVHARRVARRLILVPEP